MATDLETRPDEDQDNSRIQQHYDQKLGRGSDLDGIANQEQQAATDSGSDAAGESGGLYREEGSGGDASGAEKTLSPNDPVNPEHGGLYSGDEHGKRGGRSRFLGFNISRRKGVTGGIIGLMLGGGMFFGFGIASGPLQVIHLGEVLHHSFNKTESDSANRTRHLFRYARASKSGNIGETRVGLLGSKVFGSTIDQLKEIGIDIETGRAGQPTRTRIDTDKLKSKFPELESMNSDEKKAFLSDKLGVSSTSIGGRGSSFSIDQPDMNIRSSRLLVKSSVGLLDDGRIVSSIKTRVLTKVFDLPSLFHPIKKLKAGVTQKLVNGKPVTETERQQAIDEEANTQKAVVETAAGDGAKPQLDDLKGSFSKSGLATNSALTFTGVACSLRGAENDIVKINRARVVLPAAAAASSVMAVGSQTKSGKDISLAQVGAVVNKFTDKKGQTIWQSKPLQVLAGGTGTGLKDIDSGQKQAFGSHKTVNKINTLTSEAGANDLTCSTAGQIVQGVVTIGIAGLEEIGSGGTATAAVLAEFATKQAAQIAAVAGVMHFVMPYVEDKAAVDALGQDSFKGLSGGGLYAYGIRAAANTASLAAAGMPIGGSESTRFAAQAAAKDKQEFESKSMFARIFDINDYRSLTGRLADSVSPNAGQNLVSAASGFTHIGNTFSSIFGAFTPHATAATPEPYDWGFPQYGIPDKLLNDPRLADPYENASIVAQRLDNECKNSDGTVSTGCDPITKVHECFGVNISLGSDSAWDATTDTSMQGGVDPESSSYPSYCGNTDDLSWNRLVLFVNDTHTMKAAACYQGDDQSCQDLGTGGTTSPEKSSGGGADFHIASFNICYGIASDNTNKAACAGGQDFKPRLDKTVSTIKSNGLDVVGLQEVRGPSTPNGDQYSAIQQLLPNYSIFPKSYSGSYPGQNPIIWDSSKFALVGGGSKAIAGYAVTSGPDNSANTQVRLKYLATGQEFYVINQHEPVGNGEQDAKWRTESAQARAKYIDELSKEGIPIFITGDFNSKYRVVPQGQNNWTYGGTKDNLAYCILTTSKAVQDAFDVSSGKPVGQCPSYGRNGGVDHIYMSTGVTATDYKYFGAGVNSNGSDHNTLSVHVTIPGGSGTGGSFGVGTLNTLGANHTCPSGGGCQRPGWPDYKVRAQHEVEAIVNSGVSFIGFQELQPAQQKLFKQLLGSSWSTWSQGSVANTIAWRNDVFDATPIDEGFFPYPYYNGGTQHANWAVLKVTSTGQKVAFTNFHPESLHFADGNQAEHDQDILNMANFWKATLAQKYPGVPIVLTGDMNGDYREFFCPFGKNVTQGAISADGSRVVSDKCSKGTEPGSVDWVIASGDSGATFTNYKRDTSLQKNKWTDHPYVTATITFAASNAAVSTAQAAPSTIGGVKNFRDAAASNAVLKPRTLYRSGQLNKLTSDGSKQLAQLLGTTGTIIDLRTVSQRQNAPDASVAGSRTISIPIEGVLDQSPMVTDAARRRQLGKALKTAENAPGPVLIHCVDGKDRTGWTVAMIMYVSGASKSQVMAEYMESSKTFPNGVKEAWLNSGLDAIKSRYGSVTNYLKRGVGLSDGDLQKLDQKFGA